MQSQLFVLELTPEFKAALERDEPIRIVKGPADGCAYMLSSSAVYSLTRKDTANTLGLPSASDSEQLEALFKHKVIPRQVKCDQGSVQRELDTITPRDVTLGRLPGLTDLCHRHLISLGELVSVGSKVHQFGPWLD